LLDIAPDKEALQKRFTRALAPPPAAAPPVVAASII
jgi:hypothetical protein